MGRMAPWQSGRLHPALNRLEKSHRRFESYRSHHFTMIITRIAFLVIVDDYHEIGHIALAIQGVSLLHRELGTTNIGGLLQYVGVIFNDNSLGDSEIQDLLTAANIEIEDN